VGDGLSFTSYDMMKPPRGRLENYASIRPRSHFGARLLNTLVYIAGSTVFITVVGLGLALGSTRGDGGGACA